MLKKRQDKIDKSEWTRTAFITYNLTAKDGQSFQAYLSYLGLLDKEYMSKDARKKIAAEAHASAQKILSLLAKKKEQRHA